LLPRQFAGAIGHEQRVSRLAAPSQQITTPGDQVVRMSRLALLWQIFREHGIPKSVFL
jgi:hypothetical protein